MIVVFCVALIVPVRLDAAPCYGTRLPKKGRFVAGLQTHALFKRYLEEEYGEIRGTQHFLLLSYGVFDWLAIDLKGGAGNIKHNPQSSDEIDYRSGFAGGYGYRIKFYDVERMRAVFGFQHISVHPGSSHTGENGQTRNKAILDDWQYSLLVSYSWKSITPYAGTRWSRVDYIHRVEGERKRRMSDLTRDIGVIVGADLPLGEDVWVNLEGQFLDSEALAVSVHWAF